MGLAEVYVARCAPPSVVEVGRLETSLRELLEAARLAWPGLVLPDDAFVGHVAEHWGGEPIDAWPLARAGDLYLACACALGIDGAAWRFEHKHGAVVDDALRRLRLSGDAKSEAAQLLRARLLVAEAGERPRIASYSGRGELAAWVRAAATRLALNLLRDEPRRDSSEELAHRLPSGVDDPELRFLKARYAVPFREALKQALATLETRPRVILKEHYVDGLSTEEIGRRHGVHRVTVLRWLADARSRVARETERLLGGLGVPTHELASIARLVRSQLDASLADAVGGD